MEILLLLLLVVVAAVLYLPEIIKERALDSPLDTVSDFRRGMTALAVSTSNYKPSREGMTFYSPSSNDPEPYFRQRSYDDYDSSYEDYDSEFIPYPSNKARAQMQTRRQRIMVVLLIVALGTGIMTLVPNLKWILPLHIGVLVILAGYALLVILLPYYNRYR